MRLNKMTITIILSIIILCIEIFVIINGETLIFLTVFSTFLIYFMTRLNINYGVYSYLCVSIILFFISTHQMIFFTLTNGLLGICLGTFQSRNYTKVLRIVLSGMFLAIGVCLSMIFIGNSAIIASHWYWIFNLIIFSFAYVSIFNWLLPKFYDTFVIRFNKYNK